MAASGKKEDKLKKKIKGVVTCPHCGKGKVVVYEGGRGSASLECPHCRCYYIADADSMRAYAAEKIKGIYVWG